MKAIDELILMLTSALPGVQIEQLQAKSPGDDSGLWFVRHPDSSVEVNLESSTGEFPFLIENSADDTRLHAKTVEETIAAVRTALKLPDVTTFSLEQGNLRAWIEEESIHIVAHESPSNDPVELSAKSARRLAEALMSMAGKLHE